MTRTDGRLARKRHGWAAIRLVSVSLLTLLIGGCDRGTDPTGLEPPGGVGSSQAPGQVARASSGELIPATQPASELPSQAEPAREVEGLGPPAPTLFFTAGLKGYTEPCGCTAGLLVGGLDRLVGTIQAVRASQPESLVVDAGDLLFERAHLEQRLLEQERLKAALVTRALGRLELTSTTPGERDLALGLSFYRQVVSEAGHVVLAANLRDAEGSELGEPFLIRSVADLTVGIVGAVDPSLFDERTDVTADPPAPAVASAVAALRAEDVAAVVLVFHGDLGATEALIRQVDGVDFAVVGHDPAETDEVIRTGSASILQAYDQGRYVGVLQLYPGADGHYVPASSADPEALSRIDRRLDYLRGQLSLLPAPTTGQEPAIVASMRREVAQLEADRHDLRDADVSIPPEGGVFIYRATALEPGYPLDAEVTAWMTTYNRSLQGLNQGRTEIPPLGPDDVAFAGGAECARCHPAAHDLWLTTAHARAIETLERRHKAFDESCVGCHVTGFLEPGGAVTGNHNGLADVQCEACHGRGAAHVAEPPHHIARDAPASVCVRCHNADHSPTFDYATYRPRILGPGHGL